MNPGKEEGKEREGGDGYEVEGCGGLPASPECLLSRCLLFKPLFFFFFLNVVYSAKFIYYIIYILDPQHFGVLR